MVVSGHGDVGMEMMKCGKTRCVGTVIVTIVKNNRARGDGEDGERRDKSDIADVDNGNKRQDRSGK